MDLSTRDGRRQQGNRIRAAAQAAGLSLDDLAGRIGCSRALIYQYTSGVSLAQSDRLQQIAEVVGKPLAWFFVDDDDPDAASRLEDASDLRQEREQLRDEQRKLAAERRRFEQQRAQTQIESLYALLAASSSSVDWRRSADLCQQLLPLLQQRDDLAGMAAVLLEQGNALIQLSEWGPAKGALERAGDLFREIGSPVQALHCLQSLGHANTMLGRAAEALKQFEQVAASADWWNRWQGALSLGATYELLGDFPQSTLYLERSRQIIEERQGTPDAEFASLYLEANRANLDLDSGDYDRAALRAEHCASLAQRRGVQDQYIEALLTRGTALLENGDTDAACTSIRQALSLAQLMRDYSRLSLALASLSLCDRSLCRWTEAIAGAKEALAVALRCGAARSELLAQRALAEAYLASSNAAEASYHVDQGIALASQGRVRVAEAQFRSLEAGVELLAGRLDRAAAAARIATTLADDLGARPVQFQCRLTMARVALSIGDAEDCLLHSFAALDLAASLPGHLAWRCYSIIARAYGLQNRPEEARVAFRAALDGLDPVRALISKTANEDRALEDRHALDLWQDWLRFVAATEGHTRAQVLAEGANWPPLLEWVRSFRP